MLQASLAQPLLPSLKRIPYEEFCLRNRIGSGIYYSFFNGDDRGVILLQQNAELQKSKENFSKSSKEALIEDAQATQTLETISTPQTLGTSETLNTSHTLRCDHGVFHFSELYKLASLFSDVALPASLDPKNKSLFLSLAFSRLCDEILALWGPIEIDPKLDKLPNDLSLTLTCFLGGATARSTVTASFASWLALIKRAAWSFSSYDIASTYNIPIHYAVPIGHCELPLGEIKQLCVGDLLIFSKHHFDLKGVGVVSIPNTTLHAQIDNESIQILSTFTARPSMENNPWQKDEYDDEYEDSSSEQDDFLNQKSLEQRLSEQSLSEEDEVNDDEADDAKEALDPASLLASDDNEKSSLEKLPVKISAWVGHIDTTVGELAVLGEGSILKLIPEKKQQVRLTALNQTIAYGELVSIDEQLAVQITHIELKS